MSRLVSWFVAVFTLAIVVPTASACPGAWLIGLPILFGPDEPATSPWPQRPTVDVTPIVDLKAIGEESQSSPPTRAEQAQECLKSWRQLVRDGRFDLAPTVAAKAAALDPTNIDVQQAVMVSQVLRSLGEKSTARETPLAPPAEVALRHFFPQGLLGQIRCCESAAERPLAKALANSGCKSVDSSIRSAAVNACPSGSVVTLGDKRLYRTLSQDSELQAAAHTAPTPSKRVTIETATWRIECDRIVRANEQEALVEGDVHVTMRPSGMTVRGSRMCVRLPDGEIRTDQQK